MVNAGNTGPAEGAKFTTTHGLALGMSILGVVIVAVAVKSTLKWRQRQQSSAAKNPAIELGDGTVNQGYELS